MAIKFLESVGLKSQELQNVSLEIVTSVASTTAYQGRIVFDQTDDLLKFYSGSDLGWISLDGTGNVDQVVLNAGYNTSTGDVMTATTAGDVVSLDSFAYGGDTDVGLVPFRVSPSSTVFLNGAGNFSIPTGNMTTWKIDGDNTNPQTVNNTNVVSILGQAGLISTKATSGENLQIKHADITRAPDTGLGNTTLNFGEDFDVINVIVTEDAGDLGHISDVTTDTITFPSVTITDTTYTLTSSSGVMTLTGSDSTTDTVTFLGTANEVNITEVTSNTITIGLRDDVTIVGTLNVLGGGGATSLGGTLTTTSLTSAVTLSGTLEQTSGSGAIAIGGVTNIPIISKAYADYAQSGTDAPKQWVNKVYVDTAAQTSLVFQGEYAADGTEDVPTGATILKGFAYAVSAGGTGNGVPFSWSPALDEGDFIYANTSNPSSQSDWTQIQNNIGKSTEGIYGIARYLNSNGWATGMTAGEPALINRGASSGGTTSAIPDISFDSTGFGLIDSISDTNISITAHLNPASSQISDFNTESEAVYDDYTQTFSISNGTTFDLNHNFGTKDVFVEVFDNSKNNVFAYITRPTNNKVTVAFSTSVPAGTPMTAICNSMVIS
tara:strand:- start:574 stop:2391 length:1818 start_codon:yes stop_codon:yes gene_type:complete